MNNQHWHTAPRDPQAQAALEEAGIPPLLAAVLSARGVGSLEQAGALLDAGDDPLCDPGTMADMDRAVRRISAALERGERVAVFGDYDVDGITAACLLTCFLRERGGDVFPYIPDRLEEGYGLNREAVSALHRQGVSLIVTVDCGITAVDEVDWANSLGVDVVVTDHHECKDELPRAAAVVDPRREECPYPFKGLAGVGVALKLAMALAGPERAGAVLEEYADLAAIGTVADVMPMTGENRTIVMRGLRELDRPRRPGLEMLIRSCGMEGHRLSSVTVGYTLAPRINAAGRMGRAQLAVELLLTPRPERAEQLARELCQLNRERQCVEMDIFRQCVRRLDLAPQSGAILLAQEGWHQGVVGIVASRLAERYGCPAFMICLDHGEGKGSCRSYGGINLFQVLERCGDLLEGFGGHALAAGFTVREENIPALTARIREEVALRAREIREPELEVDVELEDPSLLECGAVEQLDRLEPYGLGNPRPVFSITGAKVISSALVGEGRHLKLRLSKRGVTLQGIFFSAAGPMPEPGSRVDAAFYPQINEYRGARSVQLQLIALRPAPTRAQLERGIYEKYCRGELLTPAEARVLLPSREEFVCLWRYLKRQTLDREVLEDTPAHLARSAARAAGQREIVPRALVCLDVLRERGLITVRSGAGRLQVSLNRVEGKVDLEASGILRRLREQSEA